MKLYNVHSLRNIPVCDIEFPCILVSPLAENYIVDRIREGVYTIKNSTTPERVVQYWHRVECFVYAN